MVDNNEVKEREIPATVEEVVNIIKSLSLGEGEKVEIGVSGKEVEDGVVLTVDIIDKTYTIGVGDDTLQKTMCTLKKTVEEAKSLTVHWHSFVYRTNGIKKIVNPELILRKC